MKLYTHWTASMPPLIPSQPLLLSASMSLTILNASDKCNLQYLSSCDWLISLNMMSSRFFHVVYVRHDFPLFKDWTMFHCMYTPRFLYSSGVGHLGCFHHLVIVKKCCNVFGSANISSISWFQFFGIYTPNGIAGLHGNSI